MENLMSDHQGFVHSYNLKGTLAIIFIVLSLSACKGPVKSDPPTTLATYPAIWFAPINDPNKPDWEILPQEAKAGEVILSKRNELGI